MNKISVVILNYNGQENLQEFLPTVVKLSPGCKVIIADNCSTDNSLKWLAEKFPEIAVVQLEENHGFSVGYNLALLQVKSTYYVLLNSDVQVTHGWIDPIIQLMDQDPLIAACQPKILSYRDKNKFEYAGAGGGFIDTLGYPFCRGRIFNSLESDQGQYDDTRSVFWATGACLFIRAEVFHQFGGFDPGFFAHMEEIDLCWRLNLSGFKIYYQGQSKVYHLGGGTLPKSNPRKTYLNFRNGITMLYKNSTSSSLVWKLPFRLLLDLVAAIKFMIFDSFRDSMAVLTADKDFLLNLANTEKQRRKFLGKTKSSKLPHIYQGSIVLDYFIKGKRFFKDINF